MKIAIDGPSASGKGTISKILSSKLHLSYLNTGKIYRIVALLARNLGGHLKTSALKIASEIEKHFKEQQENDQIYTEEVAKITSQIATFPEVREALLQFQKSFISNSEGVIMEGRDIGTVIMPNADFKFYLDASPEVRAERRVLQLKKDSKEANFSSILEDIKARDRNDIEREVAGLKIAKDAHYIDTSNKSIEDVINEILSIIKV